MPNVWVDGFLVDQATSTIVTTTDTTGAAWSFGFLRGPNGELVITVV